MAEETLWKGSPSQIVNLGRFVKSGLMIVASFVVCGVLWRVIPAQTSALNWFCFWALIAVAVALIPAIVALWAFMGVRAEQFELTSERLLMSQGVFTRKSESLELYRVRDIVIEEPFFYRMLGVGTVVLLTSDLVTPKIVIPAVREVKEIREIVRKHVESTRDRKNVRQMDIDQQQV